MINEGQLKELSSQAEVFDEQLLEAGLTVLAKDINEYLEEHPQEDSALFREVYDEVMADERKYWEQFGPDLFRPLRDTSLPMGMAIASALGHPGVSSLADRRIIHEWTVMPGRKIFEKFKVKFKDSICGKGGPYEKFVNGLVGQADLPVTIASSILAAGLTAATLWYPLAIYFALLLIKAGLKTYCEE